MNMSESAGQRTGFPLQARLSVHVRGNPVTVAASMNETQSDELVLLIAGLACSREAFDAVYTGRDHRHWIAIDLPGHGDSPPISPGGDLLGLYADVVIALVEQFAPRLVHLVGHSMGTAVALIAAPALPVGAMVAIEGNLVGEDCGLVSRSIGTSTKEMFKRRRYTRLRDELLASDQIDRRIWGAWMERADPATVWEEASSLVAWSDSGGLAGRWRAMTHRTYVLGERSPHPKHLRDLLAATEVIRIGGAAHFPMVDNPIGLADAIADALTAAEPYTGRGTV